MNSLLHKIWLLTLSLCLAMTVGTTFSSSTSTAGAFEEISMEVTELEASEKLLQRRLVRTVTAAGGLSLFPPPTLLSKISSTDFAFRPPTERSDHNGFGGYLQT